MQQALPYVCALLLFVTPAYSYGGQDLAEVVKVLLPDNPDILASDSADLNGDGTKDYLAQTAAMSSK